MINVNKLSGGLFFVIFLVAMVGCATKYISPVDGGRSHIRLEAGQFAAASSMRAVYYKNGSCDEPYILGYISGLSVTQSDPSASVPGREGLKEGSYFERVIGAGDDVNITIQGNYFGYYCSLPFSFAAEPGGKYRLDYLWKNNKCYINVDRVSVLNERIDFSRVEVKTQKNPCATGFAGPAL